jgi:putative peptide zinc metalloprotease protein
LQQFIGMLHGRALVFSDAPGRGRQLRKRRDEKKRCEWLNMFANLFAIRFRGLDPEWFLAWSSASTATFWRQSAPGCRITGYRASVIADWRFA